MYGKLPEVVLDRFPTLEEFSMWLFVATILTFLPNVVLLLFLVREQRYIGDKRWGRWGLLVYLLWGLHFFLLKSFSWWLSD